MRSLYNSLLLKGYSKEAAKSLAEEYPELSIFIITKSSKEENNSKRNRKFMNRVDISKLKIGKDFENEKIKISFSNGMISDSLSVYIKDEYGKNHHIIWEISPDRNQQNFDKANEKIRAFVQDKINEWVNEEEEAERLRIELIQNRKIMEENELQNLIDSF